MTVEERNKSIMNKIYRDMVSGHDLSLLDELFALDVVDHEAFGSSSGREGFRIFFESIFDSFPDFHMRVEDLIAEDDRVAARVTSFGTHKGEFMGIAPTGKEIAVPGIDIMRFAEGQVAEHWGVTDLAGLLEQLRAE